MTTRKASPPWPALASPEAVKCPLYKSIDLCPKFLLPLSIWTWPLHSMSSQHVASIVTLWLSRQEHQRTFMNIINAASFALSARPREKECHLRENIPKKWCLVEKMRRKFMTFPSFSFRPLHTHVDTKLFIFKFSLNKSLNVDQGCSIIKCRQANPLLYGLHFETDEWRSKRINTVYL